MRQSTKHKTLKKAVKDYELRNVKFTKLLCLSLSIYVDYILLY